MKSSEFHKIIVKNGWQLISNRGKGSHLIYEKDGKKIPVPYHGSKEIYEPFRKALTKQMGLK
jgi:predicted RNA binding protein YcfA (HicA-like mRNA interferase family)